MLVEEREKNPLLEHAMIPDPKRSIYYNIIIRLSKKKT